MSLKIIKTTTNVNRAILLTAAIAASLFVWYAAKWNFANSAATRVDQREVADFLTTLAPDDPQVRFAAAVLFDKTFDKADAIRSLTEYEATARLSPNNYFAWIELGRARERNGDIDGAESAFRRALELAPNYADVSWAYGNFLYRNSTDQIKAFDMIRLAAAVRPSYAGPAVTAALSAANGDVDAARGLIGDSPDINAALTQYFISQKSLDDAFKAWQRIPGERRSGDFATLGRTLAGQGINAGKYRLAAAVLAETGAVPSPMVETVTDGGFEGPVKLSDAGAFDWIIAAGTEPLISISSDRVHGGKASLWLVCNTNRASDFREIRQTIAVEPGKTYLLEAYYRSELRAASTFRFEVLNAADNAVLAASDPLGLNAEWTPLTVAFTAPNAVDGVIVRFIRDKCPSQICAINGKVWLDDISIRRQ